jgi:hypothetical protein
MQGFALQTVSFSNQFLDQMRILNVLNRVKYCLVLDSRTQ